ncbi:protein of unknown function DUF1648 [Ferroglobus placidus DSM 10642]|uniref:DUF1648 domain-containing protein n=1 Tax=Ferroglobus placidus (strain DSM 10642 / AEDII12DO) TaxID=589924 RepID=D3S2A8_FERPA|nr:DUF1648 domain-containing protein [Ferroglobus placidus]ADC66599.1 protein of unknown function DUF1648 [Ferroglobus placidus DSM 10642]
MRSFQLVVVLLLVLIWVTSIYAYSTLPERVPVHFNASGKADSYGGKIIFLLLPLSFSFAPVILLVISSKRSEVLKGTVWWMNLPAFFSKLNFLPENERERFVNSYFNSIDALNAFLTFCFYLLTLGIYLGSKTGELPWWFNLVIVTLLLSVIPFLLRIRRLSKEFEKVYKQSNRTRVR